MQGYMHGITTCRTKNENTKQHKARNMHSEEFEGTKMVIRIRKSKDREQNGQRRKYKRTNNDLQNTTQKTKDRVTRTPLKPGVISCTPEG